MKEYCGVDHFYSGETSKLWSVSFLFFATIVFFLSTVCNSSFRKVICLPLGLGGVHPGKTPPGRYPLGRHPPRQTPQTPTSPNPLVDTLPRPRADTPSPEMVRILLSILVLFFFRTKRLSKILFLKCIPVGCIPPALYHTGGESVSRFGSVRETSHCEQNDTRLWKYYLAPNVCGR